MSSVLQPWVESLSFMQQSVLLTAVRGPDTIGKNHPVKVLCRWYRRCVLYSAFDKRVLRTPHEPGGGSFTGALTEKCNIADYIKIYLSHVDELPHHFQLHFMHAAEILGYRHPDPDIQQFWYRFYSAVVNDMHLKIEPPSQMEIRLGDSEENWRACEEAVAE